MAAMALQKRKLNDFIVTLACVAAFCLSPSASWAQMNVEETVQRAMTIGQDGMYMAYDGHFVKWLPRFGDASAVALTKLLADKPITDTDIPAILIILHDSYGSPSIIEDATERQPRTTLYLLRSLSQVTKDPKNIARIEQATVFVKSQYAAYLRNRPDQ
jgi:hypothetical protein